MRAFKRYARAGFTLVELMIVVAIIGILAALAIYGVRRYLASAKTSEAKNAIGAISRGGVGAYERETTTQELVSEGTNASVFTHDICANAVNVPDTNVIPAGNKYQPNSTLGKDYETGDTSTGWKCLKHNMSSPSYYLYGYQSKPINSAAPAGGQDPATKLVAPAAGEFVAYANGDLNANGAKSAFGQRALVNQVTRTIKLATEVTIVDEYE